MFEITAKKNVLENKRDTYVLRHPVQEQPKAQRRLPAYDVRTSIKTGTTLQRQKRENQAVIQREPYDDYKAALEGNKEKQDKIPELIQKLEEYITRKTALAEDVSKTKNEGLAELLYKALKISKLAGEIIPALNANLQEGQDKQDIQDIQQLIGLMGDLQKFVYVELSSDEKINMDDVVDILDKTRKLIDDAEEGVSGQHRLRELGLLAVKDKDPASTSSHFVLMSNGGKDPDGTGGSVTAPGEQTPVFKDHWRDVKFIAHTHPNESQYQSKEEFKTDCEVLHGREGAARAEMVRRDNIEDGIGGTIFYTGAGVLSKKARREYYIDVFAVTKDVLNGIVDDRKDNHRKSLKEEQQDDYDVFTEQFKQNIIRAIDKRDTIVQALRGSLSSDDFLRYEEELAKLGTCAELQDHGGNIDVLFDESALESQFEHEYKKRFLAKRTADAEDMAFFAMLEDPDFTMSIKIEDEGDEGDKEDKEDKEDEGDKEDKEDKEDEEDEG